MMPLPDFDEVNFDAMQLPMIVIYDHPTDYPNVFVARLWETLPHAAPTEVVVVADSLETMREKMPPWMWRMKRHAQDDPKIVEVWL